MKIVSVLPDDRVAAQSVMVEVSVGDYLELAAKILKNNPFQRKRVRGAKGVYQLLKADFMGGCVIPPIVLSYTRDNGNLESEGLEAFRNHARNFSILDGLQRTYTLTDILSELAGDAERLAEFLSRRIRCEIYEGIDRLGILYRMLTLNTGQTPMSLRHQIEIMYLDYLEMNIDGVSFIREETGSRARQVGRYNFKDIIEGFNSYIERNESPLDRGDVLENISSLENLAKEGKQKDVFESFVKSWNAFIVLIDRLDMRLVDDDISWDDTTDDENSSSGIWARSGVQAFKRSQAITGFGAAIGLLRNDDEYLNFDTLPISNIVLGCDPSDFLESMNKSMASIKEKSRKIGNAQRLYFRQFFKVLFWEQSGCYLNLTKSQEEAYKSTLKFGI